MVHFEFYRENLTQVYSAAICRDAIHSQIKVKMLVISNVKLGGKKPVFIIALLCDAYSNL